MSKVIGYKGGGGNTHTPVESPDSVQSMARMRILIGLGEGEFDALNIDELRKRTMLNGTPIRNPGGSENFPTAKVEYRPGTQGQAPISGFSAVESETGVSVIVEQARPWSIVISNTELDAVRIRVGFPRMATTLENGDTVGARVDYTITLQTDSGSPTVFSYTLNDKTTTLYERDHRIELPTASTNWRIVVTRLTADSSSDRVQSTMQVQSWTGIVNANLRYPHTALLFIEFDAKSFQNTPQISLLARGRKVQVPTNYDPVNKTYAGDWDGSFKMAWTDNNAWHWYDICVNDRFGLGRRIKPAMLNRYALYQIAQRCDQMVPDGNGGSGTEPRHKMDIYIQSKQQAWTALKDMAASFAGMSWWGGQMLNLVMDSPTAAMAHVITNANTVDGNFTYASGTTETRNSTFIVNYSDPTNHYKDTPTAGQRVDLVRRYKINPVEATAIGCCRESEAQRRGHWMLVTNQLDKQIQFKVGLEGLFFLPGTVVPVADRRISDGQEVRGGRVLTQSGTDGRILMVDEPITFNPGDVILIRNEAGVMQRIGITGAISVDIEGSERGQVTLGTAPGVIPADRPFVVDGGQLQTQLFRITKVKGSDDGMTFDVTGVEYNDSKYDAVDHGARLDPRILTNIPDGTMIPPAGIRVSGYEIIVQGLRQTDLRIEWDKADKAVTYEAQFRRMSLENTSIGDWASDWINAPRTAALGLDISNVFAGSYIARVRAIGPGEISSPWVTSDPVAITGRIGEVPMPVAFTTTSLLAGIGLTWNFAGDVDDSAYTEIEYSTTNSAADMLPLTMLPYPQRVYQQMSLKAGIFFWYRARLVDRIGNKSEWTAIVRGQTSSDATEYLDSIGADFFSKADGEALKKQINMSAEDIIAGALADSAMVDHQWAQFGQNRADIIQIKKVQADDQKTVADLETNVNVKFGETDAALREKLTAYADADQANAIYTLKTGVKWNGQYYDSGLSISTVADGTGVVARVAVLADQFVVATGQGGTVRTVFAIDGGQTFLDTAIIKNGSIESFHLKDGTIGRAQITDVLESDGYSATGNGMQLNFATGTIRVRGGDDEGSYEVTALRSISRDDSGQVTAVMGKRL